jgi:hypothetical protein
VEVDTNQILKDGVFRVKLGENSGDQGNLEIHYIGARGSRYQQVAQFFKVVIGIVVLQVGFSRYAECDTALDRRAIDDGSRCVCRAVSAVRAGRQKGYIVPAV